MRNLQTLANELAANKMTLVTNDMLNLRGGCGCSGGTHKAKSVKAKSFKVKSYKVKSFKIKSVKGGYGCGW
jgi:hypothetical protein